MLIGCIFCHYVHTAKGTLNTHLNLYVPEMATARGVPLEEDSHHHVGMIRELRWVERGRLEQKITWNLSSDGDERVVLQAYSALIYHPVQEYAKDDFKCRQFRKIDTAFWRRQIRATLAEYRLQPRPTRKWYLECAVQESLERALTISEMRVPAAPAAMRVVSKTGDVNSQTAIGVGRDARLNNRVESSFNNVTTKTSRARMKQPVVVESSESSDTESDDDDEILESPENQTHRHATLNSSDSDSDSEDEEPKLPAGRKRRPAPEIPESPETPPVPQPRKKVTGKGKSVSRALHGFASDSDHPTRGNHRRVNREPTANTVRSPSVFASPSHGRSRPAYASIADWNTPTKRSRTAAGKTLQQAISPDSDADHPDSPPAAVSKKLRPRVALHRKTPAATKHQAPEPNDDEMSSPDALQMATPLPTRRVPSATSPAIEPLLVLSVTVLGCHKASLRIYPGIDLSSVIERAFADAPKAFVGLSANSGIRGIGVGPVAGWKRVWDADMWSVVLDAARECATAPVWRAEVVFLGT